MRLLLLTPVVDSSFIGGLQLALDDLRRQLELRGWQVDAPIYRAHGDAISPSVAPMRPWAAALQKSQLLLRLRAAIPASLRLTLSSLLQTRASFEAAAQNLRWAEQRLADPNAYDAVLVCVDTNVRGILALALALHPNVTVLSLAELAGELRPALWNLVRLRTRHPYHYRPARPDQIERAIFASDRWRRDALAAGLPAQAAHTVYFGIPIPPCPLRPQNGNASRILWAGRLTPEKGFHLLLDALPELLAQRPGVTVTAVAAQGEPQYRALIETQIAARGLANAVTLLPPVPRDKLPELYASHDVLFFYSINPEPVSLLLMDAYAHCLPAVAHAAPGSPLVHEEQTCLTYHTNQPHSLAAALSRLLDDATLRARLAANARRVVEEKFSLAACAKDFHSILLSSTLSRKSHPISPASPAPSPPAPRS
jgi:glycosyltransferase involved in cell wall biosynthesis